jgi:Fe-S-cluster containining protein
MDIDQKIITIFDIYKEHESALKPYKKIAICKRGCAFCCTHYGSLDITTLEGLIIYNHISQYKKSKRININKAISQNRRRRESGKPARCPFLNKNDTCSIYDIRPFSCRQLYSVKDCRENGPTLHRQANAITRQTIKRLQHLDDTGYSGHLSYMLHMLTNEEFREYYLNGGFDPGQIRDFGKSHGIVINRMMG